PKADHLPIITVLDAGWEEAKEEVKRNFRGTDWEEFRKEMTRQLEEMGPPVDLATGEELEEALEKLETAIQQAITAVVPLSKGSTGRKRWWSRELEQMRKEVGRKARATRRWRHTPIHPSHGEYEEAREQFGRMLIKAKKEFWEDWLEGLDTETAWVAHKFVRMEATD
ncbi:hypothetical protein BKA70DRAFT_1087167, partial [Coprinopsis sp. MPI-PUGE-AT-0042]